MEIVDEKKNLIYIVEDILGKGTFGQVFKAKIKNDNNSESVAIKVVKNKLAYMK